MKTLLTFLALLSLVPLSSCDDDEINRIPRATQEGLNTFGCLIDWELLIPKGGEGLGIEYSIDSVYNSIGEFIRPPYFTITASNWEDNGGDLIYLYLGKVDVGIQSIGISNNRGSLYNPVSHALANVYDNDENVKRYNSFDNSGEITVTKLDTINHIISGTFYLKMVDIENRSDTIEVRDGRFDINWRTLNCGKPRHLPCP